MARAYAAADEQSQRDMANRLLADHIEMAAAGEPVNRVDPSGNSYVTLLVVFVIAAVIGALGAGAVAEAQGRVVTLRIRSRWLGVAK